MKGVVFLLYGHFHVWFIRNYKFRAKSMEKYPIVLTIAGSDSVGGAGIQADIKTCCALGVYAMSAITAITAQNTSRVFSFVSVGEEMLEKQLCAVIEDERPDAVKIGMLPDQKSIQTVVKIIDKYNLKNIVLDPVMVATSGDNLTSDLGNHIGNSMKELISRADIITPNIPEAEYLTGEKITKPNDIENCIKSIFGIYNCKSVILKGGHLDNEDIVDTFASRQGERIEIKKKKINTINTHGTGCSLSSAIACFLALDYPMTKAVTEACEFINEAILRGKDYKLGKGRGPINHLFKIQDYDNKSKQRNS